MMELFYINSIVFLLIKLFFPLPSFGGAGVGKEKFGRKVWLQNFRGIKKAACSMFEYRQTKIAEDVKHRKNSYSVTSRKNSEFGFRNANFSIPHSEFPNPFGSSDLSVEAHNMFASLTNAFVLWSLRGVPNKVREQTKQSVRKFEIASPSVPSLRSGLKGRNDSSTLNPEEPSVLTITP
jgi:hypothetical protein